MYIMALLGIELFSNFARFNVEDELITNVTQAVADGVYMHSPRENFDDVGNALTTVFILILGEDWPGVMYTHMRVYGDYGYYVCPYFLITFSAGNLIMLSLFTAILLQNFEGDDDEDEDEDASSQDESSDDEVKETPEKNNAEESIPAEAVEKVSFLNKVRQKN